MEVWPVPEPLVYADSEAMGIGIGPSVPVVTVSDMPILRIRRIFPVMRPQLQLSGCPEPGRIQNALAACEEIQPKGAKARPIRSAWGPG